MRLTPHNYERHISVSGGSDPATLLFPVSFDVKKLGSKRALWEKMRALFHCFRLESMEMLYLALLHGFVLPELIITRDTS